ncbi:MAG: hypothetical protein V4726_18815 [Verrucomicrobiota bacterium]
MKITTNPLFLAGILSAGISSAGAGTFTADFNDGQTPAGSNVYSGGGGGVVELTGGVDNTGCFKITKAALSQSGSLVVDDLDEGGEVNSVLATWKMRMGGGGATPADGVAFCVANGIGGTFGPEGTGSGLRVVFDTYNNTPAAPPGEPASIPEAPAVDIYWAGSVVAHLIVPIESLRTGDAFADASVKLDSDGSLDVTYNGRTLYSNFFIPGYFTLPGTQYAWGGATGGAFENQFIDNVSLTTTTGVVNPGITQAPRAMTVLEGYAGWFSVAASENSTIQWQKKAPGAAGYSNIDGATTGLLTTPAATAADSGSLYRAVISLNGVDLNSDPVALTVTTLPPPAAQLSYNFNSGTVPAPTELRGDAIVQAAGGVDNSGFLQLTSNEGGKSGTWVIPDTRDGAAVDGLFAQFRINMTPSAGGNPADGFGLHFASDLPATGSYPGSEEAVGTGLSVCFDVYNNANNEAPAVDVFWHGAKVTTVPYPGTFFNTQSAFVDARVRLETDGTLDVSFNGVVAVSNLALPGFYPVSAGQIGFSARTGGAFQLHAVDNVDITTQLFTGPVTVARQPGSYAVVQGYPASFSVLSNDPKRTTYQWQRREPGATAFTDINGATAATYPLATATYPADNQAAFRVVLTSSNGTTATSDPAVLTVVNLVRPSPAQVIYTFDTGTVVNTGTATGVTSVISGTSTVSTTGGVGNTGVFHITDDTAGQSGGLIIPDFNAGKSIGSFKAAFAVRSAAAATPADGWSFSWGGGIAAGFGGDLEQGVGGDLRVSFDVYDNGGGEAPAIDVFWRGASLAHMVVPRALLQTGDAFEEVRIEVTNDGKISVAQDGVPTQISVQIPGFIGLSGASFAFAGRTGGSTATQWIDNFALQTELYAGPISFASQPPATAAIAEGVGVTLAATVNDPTRTTFQWQRKLPGDPEFSNINGATAATYDTPALSAAENGVQYRLVATATTNTVTSNVTTIAVYALNLPVTPELSLTFDNGELPPDGIGNVYGNAAVLPAGGISNTGYILLTEAAESQTGSFVLEDQDGGAEVTSMTAEFYVRISGGTSTPADGMSFSWSTSVASAGFREEGTGNDLIVAFDTYNNDNVNPEAPAIELKWRGESLGNIRVPIDLLMDPDFVQVLVRVNSDGTCDVVFDSQVIFWHKALPGWAPLAGARYGWGGATGGANENNALDNIRITTTVAGEQPAAAIAITVIGGEIVITFQGTLQTSTTTSGWETVQNAVSPLRIPLTGLGGTRRFWRAVP